MQNAECFTDPKRDERVVTVFYIQNLFLFLAEDVSIDKCSYLTLLKM